MFKASIDYLTAHLVGTLKLSDKGATAVEYAIVVAAIAAVLVALVVSIGNETNTAYQTLDTEMDALPGAN